MNARYTRITPVEVRLLSELMQFSDGTSPTNLARFARIARPSVYTMLRRLEGRKLVKSRPDRESPRWVIYAITAKGRREREAFAKMVGLKP